MATEITREVGGALAAYFHGGLGPSHSKLDSVFARSGCADADPAPASVRAADRNAGRQSTNKEQRVNAVFAEAVRRGRARLLTEALLEALRLSRTDFTASDAEPLKSALQHCGFMLTDDGRLEAAFLGGVSSTATRPAIDDQLRRLRRAEDDPGLMLGTSKEMLESAAKYVLEELGTELPGQLDFPALVYLARERLAVRPVDVAASSPETAAVKRILGAAGTIAEQVNYLRNREGTGHGRTLPSGVSEEIARLVVREACSVTELLLSALDARLAAGR